MRRCLDCGATFAPADGAGTAGWQCPACGHEPPRIAGFPAFAPEIAGGGSGFDPSHFAEFARLEAGNFWFRARNRLITWAIARYFPGAASLLEVGCGTGYVLAGVAEAFPGLQLAGSEAAAEGLAFAAQRVPQAKLMQMDARRIPFRDEFDVAAAFDVIEHIEDDRAVLAELAAAVVPGGGVLLTVPQHPFLWSEFDARVHHVRRYRAAELRSKLEVAGLEVVRMTSFVTVLLPLMLLSRWTRGRARPDYDPLAELKLSPFVNWPMEKALDLERQLLRAGLDLPAGGSLLAVARRLR